MMNRVYHIVMMPLDERDRGPATIGVDAVKITFEIWDRENKCHAVFDELPEAVDAMLKLNERELVPLVEGYLKLRDEMLGTPEADDIDVERFQSAEDIVGILCDD